MQRAAGWEVQRKAGLAEAGLVANNLTQHCEHPVVGAIVLEHPRKRHTHGVLAAERKQVFGGSVGMHEA